jgi:hypothetical protein
MAINVCEDHGDVDAICVFEYGKKCPFCAATEKIEELEEQIEAARKSANAIQEELQEQLDEAERNMKNMADSA